MAVTTLLIDGDVEAFAASCVSQEVIDWDSCGEDGGGTTVELNEDGAEDYLVSALRHYKEHLDADRLIVCLSDKENWRKKLWPDYKANRKDIARPLLLEHCKKFLEENYEVERWSRLEADDVMGLLSQTIPNSIIVSVDKDMKNVPCRLYNPRHPDRGVVAVSLFDAFRNHMIQALKGDPTDGYKGCPGIGSIRSEQIINEVLEEPPKRGQSAFDWMIDFNEERKKTWNTLKDTYIAKGMTAEDALLQTRLAHILWEPGDYNRRTAKVRLWQAPV